MNMQHPKATICTLYNDEQCDKTHDKHHLLHLSQDGTKPMMMDAKILKQANVLFVAYKCRDITKRSLISEDEGDDEQLGVLIGGGI